MKIHVEMEEAEMQDFLQFRKEKKTRNAVSDRLQELAKKVFWALGPDTVDEMKVTVIDQDHAVELMEMAAIYIE